MKILLKWKLFGRVDRGGRGLATKAKAFVELIINSE